MNTTLTSPAQRLFSFVSAIVIAVALFGGTAVTAQGRSAGYYSATLATAAQSPRTIAASLVWTCTGTACTAARGTSRPAIVCARLVRELGPVTAFVANGTALSAADIERCNAAA